MKYIHHHLGMGDHICCNGMVRQLVAEWSHTGETVGLFCKECNARNVVFMYRDVLQIAVVPLPLSRDHPVGEREMVAELVATAHGDLVTIGFEALHAMQNDPATRHLDHDECFYRQMGIDYSVRFNGFWYERDMGAETEALSRMVPDPSAPYVFVDSDPGRIDIPTLNCPAGLPRDISQVVYNRPDIPLFHLGLVLERATEIHVAESSIRCLLEGRRVLQIQPRRLVCHAFRGAPGRNSILPWTLVWQDGSTQEIRR